MIILRNRVHASGGRPGTSKIKTTQDLLELPSPQWATKHPLARCQIAADPTRTTHYQPTRSTHNRWWRSCRGLSRRPCSLLWPLHHLCHPKNNIFMSLLQRNQYLLPKTNNKNQTTGATTPVQLPTTPLSPQSVKPRRGVVLTYPNPPSFVVGGVCWLAHRWWESLPRRGINPQASALPPHRGCS